MMTITNLIRFNYLRGDTCGGVTAAVVSLPPALDCGAASDVHSLHPLVDSMGRFVAAFLSSCLAVSQR
ncbi:MAG: hypothetical protein MUF72_13090 [Elainella sp. Prado103]|nr:hypothetical protein [Elainella sp. Prado103]